MLKSLLQKNVSIETQTNLTWPEKQKHPKEIEPKEPPKEQPKPNNKNKQSSSSQTVQKPIPSSQTGARIITINRPDKTVSDRQVKGSDDPIKQYNKYSAFGDMDEEGNMLVDPSPSQNTRRHRSRSKSRHK